MRYFIASIVLWCFIACSDHKMDPFEVAVQTEITNIMTKEIASVGKIIEPIQVNSLEIEKVSKQEYYNYEWTEQDKIFKKYMELVKKRNFPFSLENGLRHDSVMSYLEREKAKASTDLEIYKINYHLKAATQTGKYNQLRTIFLDSSLKKIEIDYSQGQIIK